MQVTPDGPRSPLAPPGGVRAFTLLELLVVIAIITVLLGVLLPALSSARSEGTKAKCLSNLHALGQALFTYSLDDASGYTSPIHPQAETHWLYDGEYEYGGKTGIGVYGHKDFIAENRILNNYLDGGGGNVPFELFEGPTAEMNVAGELAQTEMIGAFDLDPRLEVNIGVGKNWLDAK